MNIAVTQEDDQSGQATPAPPTATSRNPVRTIWAGLRAAVGALLGLVPHVMHHIGLLAGAAILTGAFGNAVLYVVGLALSIPMLNRIHKRYRTWKAPVVAVAVFTGLFALSAFVIGPALNPGGVQPPPQTSLQQSANPSDHAAHHS